MSAIAILILSSFAIPEPGPLLQEPAPAVQAEDELSAALARAGQNRAELERALAEVPDDQRAGMRWLIAHMPDGDLANLGAEFLLENCAEAYGSWRGSPWYPHIDEELFFDTILPYASVNERREPWRAQLRELAAPLVKGAETPGQAAAMLNNQLFGLVGVKYSTQRRRADQGPLETMESGLASCTGLSILLIDACRSVGVPARFVGTPRWSDNSGNHSWVEVWDEGWHFTGAAEPSGDELDQAWFTGRASGAVRDDPNHAIYAVTWRRSPIHFPLVWRPDDKSVPAVNVTDRYASKEPPLEEGFARVRFRVLDADTGQRISIPIDLIDGRGQKVFSGVTKNEGFDANDHLTARLRLGRKLSHCVEFGDWTTSDEFTVEHDEQLITLRRPPLEDWLVLPDPPAPPADPIRDLQRYLREGNLEELVDQPFAREPLDADQAALAAELLRWHHHARIRAERAAELEARVLELDGLSMPFWYEIYGTKPTGGRSLFISMHGGGGAPAEVNDQQWKNQKRLYEPEEGVYLAPRAPTDTWNLWHQGHIDDFFDRLIEDLAVFEDVNPDRVYLMGYSAGGDGVFQLAPRWADRLAAAAMMAGHPNETQPDGLRNLPFTLHMGGQDSAYGRNEIGRTWKRVLAELRQADPGGYEHWVEIYEAKGHWMDREDAAAVPWMAKYTRDLRPERIVWLQDDVTHERFYWLAVEEPKARERLVVEREGQEIRILESAGPGRLAIRLDDSMVDLDEEVVVLQGEAELFRERIPRTVEVLARTLAERGDPSGVFCAEVWVELGE